MAKKDENDGATGGRGWLKQTGEKDGNGVAKGALIGERNRGKRSGVRKVAREK